MTVGGAPLLETWYSAEATSARSARHAVRTCLSAVDRRVVEEVELLTGEVFTHTAATARGVGRVCVRVQQLPNLVHVEVAHEQAHDGGPATAPALAGAAELPPEPVDGALLERLLDAFSTSWGRSVDGLADGATWFEMRLLP